MKSVLLFLTLMFCSLFYTKAQIVIDANELAPIGSSFRYSTAVSPLITLDSNASSWDFSQLSFTNEAAFTILTPSDCPYSTNFAESNYAIKIERNQEIVYAFEALSDTALIEYGYSYSVDGNEGYIKYRVPGVQFYWPMNYKDFYVPFYVRIDTITSSSIIFKRVEFDSVSVCGYGTVKLPSGEMDALMINRIRFKIDSTFDLSGSLLNASTDREREVLFLTDDTQVRFMIAEGYYGDDDVLDSVDVLNFSYVALAKNNGTKLRVYPNPSTDFVFVSGLDAGSYQVDIYQTDGRLVKSFSVEGPDSKLYVGDLDKGQYLLIISSGAQRYHAKIIR